MSPNPASLFLRRGGWVRAHSRLVFGVLVGVLAAGQSSGCSRGPDLAGIYFLPASDPDNKWAIESLIELRNDGSAMMQGLSMYPAQWSKRDVKVETLSEGKWWLEGDSLIYQGTVTTASTLEGEKRHGREPIRLTFTRVNEGDLLLATEDMHADAVRYIRDNRRRLE
jgi:hypothetical protein